MIAINTDSRSPDWSAGKKNRARRIFRQTGKANCLDAAVQTLCAHFKLPIPTGAEIRRLSGATGNGASMLGARNCLEQVGFFSHAGRCSIEDLYELSAPAMAVVTNADGSLHYVVVNRACRNRIEVLDPAGGIRTRYPETEFDEIWTGTLLLVSPKPDYVADLETASSPALFLGNLFHHFRFAIFSAIGTGLLQLSLVILGLLLLRQFITSSAFEPSPVSQIGLLLGFLLVAGFKVLFSDCYERIRSSIKRHAALGLELQVTDHVQRMTTEALERADSGELARQGRSSAAKIGEACSCLTDGLVHLVMATVIVATIGLLDESGIITNISILMLVLIPALSYLPGRRIGRLVRESNEANENARKNLAETISGIRPIRYAGASLEYQRDLRRLQLEAFRTGEDLEQQKLASRTRELLLGGLIATLILGVSAFTARDYGMIIVFFILLNMMTFSLRRFSISVAKLPDFTHSARQYLDLLSEPIEQFEYEVDSESKSQCRGIRFEDVTWRDPEQSHASVSGLSFELKAGQCALLIDEADSSTEAIAALLTDRAAPDDGRILIDDVDIRDLSTVQVRNRIAYTASSPFIFQATVRDNIVRGEDFTSNEINEIVSAAGLDELVQKLPKRLQTIIGRQGMFTTWHERYRIGLARVLAGKSEIVVLDLPRYRLTPQIADTINGLIRNQWNDRAVIILSSQPQPDIQCTRSFHFNSQPAESLI